MLTVEKIGGTSMSQFQMYLKNIVIGQANQENIITVFSWFLHITMLQTGCLNIKKQSSRAFI